jgi:hypothetical protein
VNPNRLRPWVMRGGLLATFVVAVLLFTNYGTFRVPDGMDTMPELPPGSFCLIQKEPREVRVGAVVLFRVPGGGMLLSRVAAVHDHGVVVAHDATDSRFGQLQGDAIGVVPFTELAGLVLYAHPAQPLAEVPTRGR